MKNNRITAPIIIPAELRPEEFATYYSALAAWLGENRKNLEGVFQDYRTDTKSENSPKARMEFFSFLFLECQAGIDFLAAIRQGRHA